MSGVIVGALEIQLMSDIARLRKDMNDAKSAVGESMQSITSAVDLAKKAMIALTGVAGVNAFKNMILGAIEGAAKLHDLSQQTGASVESLSALSAVGKLSGTSSEQLATAMGKLSKNMALADEDSKGAAQAVKALGIDFDSFQRMSPDQRMVAIAKAMDNFADGSGKSAAAQALLGKEGAKLLPYLHDLAETGQLQARVTSDQAAQADQFSDNLVKLQASGSGWKKELAMGMLPVLNEAAQAFLDVMNGSGGVRDELRKLSADGSIASWTRSAVTGLTYVSDAVEYVWRLIKSFGEGLGGLAAGVMTYFSGIGAAGVKLLKGDFAGALDEVASTGRQMGSIVSGVGESISTTFGEPTMGQKLRARIEDLQGMGRKGQEIKPQLDMHEPMDSTTEAAKKATKEYDSFMAKLSDLIAQRDQELAGTTKLTEADKLAIEAKRKFTGAALDQALAELQVLQTRDQSVDVQRRAIKADEDAVQARIKEYDAQQKTLDKLREEIAAQQAANDTLATGVDATAQLAIAKLRDAAASADRQALVASERQEDEGLAETFRAQAKALRDLADLKEQGIALKAAKDAADEWKKTTDSIYNGLTDSLFRAFESGKGFGEVFGSSLLNTFKTLVLKPGIQSLVESVSGVFKSGMSWLGSLTATTVEDESGGHTTGGVGMGSLSSLSPYAAIIGAGISQSMSDYEKGWNRDGLDNGFNRSINWQINPIYSSMIKPLESLGLINSKWADILGGDTAIARLFGMKPAEVTGQGIQGTVGAGAFSGSAYQDWHADGGWFRSDKNGTNYGALDAPIAGSLNKMAFGVLSSTFTSAMRLGLDTQGLAGITMDVRQALTGKADEDAKVLTQVFNDYSVKLASSYAHVLADAAKDGETAADTLGRLASSLGAVNTTFDTLGLHLVATSVAGGAAASKLVDLTGGLDAFVAKTSNYLRDYFSEAEQGGVQSNAILRELADAGIDFSGATSRGDLRKLMESIDPNAANGAAQMAALLDVSEQFAKVADYLQANNLTLGQLAAQAPASVGVLNAQQSSAEQLATANDHLTSVASNTAQSAGQLAALVALQQAANQALLAQLAALQAAVEDGNRPTYFGDLGGYTGADSGGG